MAGQGGDPDVLDHPATDDGGKIAGLSTVQVNAG